MADGRLARFAGGLGLGYLHTLAVLVAGLWLTPFLLRQLGSHDYGLWLLGSQVLVYLALLDLGVVALVPREVAFAAGQRHRDGGGNAPVPDVAGAVGRTMALVAWQMPAVALAACIAVWLLPAEWEPLRRPFAIVAAGFVVAFPLRVFIALLQGLQDLAFVGTIQLAGWAVGTAATVGLSAAGLGLYALAAGWVVSQLLPAAIAWRRVASRYPSAFPRRARLSWADIREQARRGSWISVGQVGQVFLSGTDLVVVGRLLGPEAIVPYACTGKLIATLAHQPQLFMQMALPALSELRGSAARARLFEVSRGMTQLMLLASGAIVAVVLVVNAAFVAWWVGESRFGGTALTALLLAGMLARHVNVTMVYTLFCFGYERRLALTPIADGLIGLGAMLLLVPRFGAHGAAAALLLATFVVSLPANLRALAREQGMSPWALARSIAPWFVRFAGVLAAAIALIAALRPQGLAGALPLAAAIAALYAAVMIPVLRAAPLGPMLTARLRPWLERLPHGARRLATETLESPAA